MGLVYVQLPQELLASKEMLIKFKYAKYGLLKIKNVITYTWTLLFILITTDLMLQIAMVFMSDALSHSMKMKTHF